MIITMGPATGHLIKMIKMAPVFVSLFLSVICEYFSPGVVYELSQGEHRCTWDPDYPEHPGRLLSVLARCDHDHDHVFVDDGDDEDHVFVVVDDDDFFLAGAMTLAFWADAREFRPGKPLRMRLDS